MGAFIVTMLFPNLFTALQTVQAVLQTAKKHYSLLFTHIRKFESTSGEWTFSRGEGVGGSKLKYFQPKPKMEQQVQGLYMFISCFEFSRYTRDCRIKQQIYPPDHRIKQTYKISIHLARNNAWSSSTDYISELYEEVVLLRVAYPATRRQRQHWSNSVRQCPRHWASLLVASTKLQLLPNTAQNWHLHLEPQTWRCSLTELTAAARSVAKILNALPASVRVLRPLTMFTAMLC